MFDFKAKHSLVALTACLLGACATQNHVPRPIIPERTAASFESRLLGSEGLNAYMVEQGYPDQNFPLKTWGLPELTLAAFHYHPQLKVAYAQWQTAQAAEITAAQKPNPGFNASAEHHSKTDGGISPWTLGFSFNIPIETGDKRVARIALASNLSEAARIEIGQVAWKVRSRLRNQFLEFHASRLQTALLAREVELREQIVQMLQNRLEAGLVSNIELNNARLQAQKANQALLAEQGKLPALRTALAEAIGLSSQALDNIELGEIPPLPKEIPDQSLQRSALRNRLDIRSSLARYAAAEEKLRLEIARQRPDISLAPGYSFDQGDNRWSLGLSMILALLNRNEGPIAEADAQRELEMRKFEELQLHVIDQAHQSRVSYLASVDEISKAEKLLAAQQQRMAQTEQQFDAGFADRLDLTGARLEALGAEQGLLAAQIRAQRALSQLEDAVQIPLDHSAPPALPNRKDAQS